MTVEGNVFSAFVTELEKRLQLDAKNQFLAFPEFSLRIGLDDLLFEAQDIQKRTGLDAALAQREALLNQERLSVLVNQIPEASSSFLTDGRMLWSIYERVINTAKLSQKTADGADDLTTALWFQELRTNFTLAERESPAGDGIRFYATGVPRFIDVTDADGWTRIVLDRQRIDERSRESSPATRAWLEERGLLDGAEGAGVQMIALSAEIFSLPLHRDWFEPAVFSNRAWHWEDGQLSDGGDPRRGSLPAYITSLLLVRKLQIELDVAPQAQQPGNMARLAAGGKSSILATLAPPSAAGRLTQKRLKLLPSTLVAEVKIDPRYVAMVTTSLEPAPTAGMEATIDLHQFATMTMSQDQVGKRLLDLGPLGNLAVAFPAPVAFLSRPILDRITAEQASLAGELAQLNAERAKMQVEVADLEQSITRLDQEVRYFRGSAGTVKISDYRRKPVVERVVNVDALRRQLADFQQSLPGKQAELVRLNEVLATQTGLTVDLQELKKHYEMLSRAGGDDSDIFVLCCVCAATPKSPDPDPVLFA